MTALIANFVTLFVESAPWLLLGLFIAGLMKWFVPITLLQKQLGGRDLKSIVKAALIGAPLPLCSCGVIPAAIGLRRSGASKPASISFLVATPETGIDSVSISYALLGPFMAIIRPVSAIFSAIYTGLLVRFMTNPSTEANAAPTETAATCCHNETKSLKTTQAADCGSKTSSQEEATSLMDKLRLSLNFSTGKLLQDISGWLVIGLVVAAMVKTWVPDAFLTQWGSGLAAMLVMALIGIPMYICATASTPIAAGFLAAGVSPGAVVVFMLAGPATNLSTMGMIRQEMGSTVLVAYLTGIMTASIGIGYFTNWFLSEWEFTVVSAAVSEHPMQDSILYSVSAVLLAGLMLRLAVKNINWKVFKRVYKH